MCVTVSLPSVTREDIVAAAAAAASSSRYFCDVHATAPSNKNDDVWSVITSLLNLVGRTFREGWPFIVERPNVVDVDF